MIPSYHTEVYFAASGKPLAERAIRAEWHIIGGSNLRQTPARSYLFVCERCGAVYGQRVIAQVAPGWPETIWSAEIGLCSAHGSGSLLFDLDELDEHDRYPEPIPFALLLYEFLVLSAPDAK